MNFKKIMTLAYLAVTTIAVAEPADGLRERSEKVTLIVKKEGPGKITGLDVELVNPPILESPAAAGEKPRYFVKVRAKFLRPGWTLMLADRAVPGDGQNVELLIEQQSEVSGLEVVAVGPDGTTEREMVVTYYPWFEKLSATESSPQSKWDWISPSVATGLAYHQVAQTGFATAQVLNLYARIFGNLNFLPDPWTLGGETFFSTLSLVQNPASAQFSVFTMRGFVGRKFLLNSQLSWEPRLGGALSNTLPAAGTPGYHYTGGPFLEPTLHLIWGGGRRASTSARATFLLATWTPQNPVRHFELGWNIASEFWKFKGEMALGAEFSFSHQRTGVEAVRSHSSELRAGAFFRGW